jgi:hypothetical protein
MKRPSLLLAGALVLALAGPPAAQAQRQPPPENTGGGGGGGDKVQVVEVQIRKKVSKDYNFDNFDQLGSTRLRVLFKLPNQSMLGLDPNACKLTSCKDDKGTDLTKDESPFTPKWVDHYSVRISKDGKAAEVGLFFPGYPASGATKISLKGSLAITVGKDEKTEEKKGVTLTDNGVMVGTFKVVRPQFIKPFGNQTPVEVNSPANNIKGVQFFDGNGNELKTFLAVRGTGGFGDKMYFRVEYDVTNLPENFTVRVTYYAKTETITVPLEVETGIGP